MRSCNLKFILNFYAPARLYDACSLKLGKVEQEAWAPGKFVLFTLGLTGAVRQLLAGIP